MVNTSTMTVLAEVFQIQPSAVPSLSAYQLDVQAGDLTTLGGKLAFRLQKTFSGHWIWSMPWLVTDTPQSSEAIQAVVEELWEELPDLFRGLHSVSFVPHWQPTAQVQADFVARGLWADFKSSVAALVSPWNHRLGPSLSVHRTCDVRGWVVQGQPALSISVDSRLTTHFDVQSYVQKVENPQELIGLMVADKATTLKGTITKITGTVVEHRHRLLKSTKIDQAKEYIRQAADHELVVHVHTGHGPGYDYVARALQVIVRTADYTRFHIDAKQATQALRLAPDVRSAIIGKAIAVAKEKRLVSQKAYNSQTSPALFLRAEAVNFSPTLLIGRGQKITVTGERDLYLRLQRFGLYQPNTSLPLNEPLRIIVLNTLKHIDPTPFLQGLQQELRTFQCASQVVTTTLHSTSRDVFEKALQELSVKSPSIVLALLPEETKAVNDESSWGPYEHFKSLTIGLGIPGQVITPSTLRNRFALGNIVLGILSKLGNIPYILAEPLPYADVVVGIDVAHRKKERLTGSINATAITRVYQNSGHFLQYALHDAPLEGETIPTDVLHAMFPATLFTHKRVIIHRDGPFRGREKQELHRWAQHIGAQFHCVEIMKTGTPRLYGVQKRVVQPSKGSAFKLNDSEAFLISSLPPFDNVTPYPLRLKCDTSFPIEQAIHSVLALTLLHYGSLRSPRLPITIHYSDEIAYLALKGIKPKALEGTIPFWL